METSVRDKIYAACKARINCNTYRWSRISVEQRDIDKLMYMATDRAMEDTTFLQWAKNNWSWISRIIPSNRRRPIWKILFEPNLNQQ